MKLRTMAMVVFGVGALAGVGCSKKPKEQKAPDMGTAAMGTGAGTAMAGTGAEPPKEAKLEGQALADRYVECVGHVNGQKWDEFKTKCLAADFKAHEADGPDLPNPDAVIDFLKAQHAAMPDIKMSPQFIMVNGRNILAVGLIQGTHTAPLKSPMGEIPATNKKIGQLMFHKLTINDDNKATEEWVFHDPATMMAQLGLMPKEAPPMRAALEKGWDGAPVIVVAADNDVEKKNLDTVKKAHDAFAARKSADYAGMLTDDTIESDQAGGQDAKGKKEVQAGADVFLKAFPDLKLETKDSYAAGDYVVLIGQFSGTNNGPLGPMKPTKKPVTGQYAEVLKLKDGKIAELWRFRNGLAMMQQMGLAPGPGAPPPGGAPAGGSAAPAGGSAADPAKKSG